MSLGLRFFIAEDDGTLTRLAVARYSRWVGTDELLPPHRAGRELRLLEVVVDVDRRQVLDVVRILPLRHVVHADGRLDADAMMRLALKGFDPLRRERDLQEQIERLEADANRFWWPTDAQLEAVGAALLRRPPRPSELLGLRAALFARGDA